MAFYRTDMRYDKGIEMIGKLEGEQKTYIKYVFDEKDKYISKLQNKINEMQEVFKGIKKFI